MDSQYYTSSTQYGKLVQENKIEAYNFPQGVVGSCGGRLPPKTRLDYKVGLSTYIDPRIEGGKMNSKTTKDLIKVIEIDGEEYLLYPSFHVDVALIRGSVADENGNLTMDREGILLEALPLARNC